MTNQIALHFISQQRTAKEEACDLVFSSWKKGGKHDKEIVTGDLTYVHISFAVFPDNPILGVFYLLYRAISEVFTVEQLPFIYCVKGEAGYTFKINLKR